MFLSAVFPASGTGQGRWAVRDGQAGGEVDKSLGVAWERFMAAERRLLGMRKDGQLARAIGEALPEESREELDRMAEEDRRMAGEGMIPLMDVGGGIRHKHVDELEPADAADRVRAESTLLDWLVSRTEERLEQVEAWLPSRTTGRPDPHPNPGKARPPKHPSPGAKS